MKLSRSPSQNPNPDRLLEQTRIASIKPDELKAAVATGNEINVTQQHAEDRVRLSKFHIAFEDSDIIPILEGAIERLKRADKCLNEVRTIIDATEPDAAKRIVEIRRALRKLQRH